MVCFKFLVVAISEDLKQIANAAAIIKIKAQHRLYFLRILKKTYLSANQSFYCCSIESILMYCITVQVGNSSAADRAALQRVIKTARAIIGHPRPPLKDIYLSRLPVLFPLNILYLKSKLLSVLCNNSHLVWILL